MLYAAFDGNAVAAPHFPPLALGLKQNVSTHHINHLVMRMAMARSLPTFFKCVTHQHEMRVVCQHLTPHSRYRCCRFGGVSGGVNDSGIAHRFPSILEHRRASESGGSSKFEEINERQG